MKRSLIGFLTSLGLFALSLTSICGLGEADQSKIIISGKSNQSSLASFPNDDRTKKIFEQEQLIKEASDLVKQGSYEEAIIKYRQATKPELLLHDYDADRPIFLMAKALKFQGKYEEALSQIQTVLKKYPNIQDDNWNNQVFELQTLIKARDTKSPQPIYQHIEYLKRNYKKYLPPEYILAGTSEIMAGTIARLYEHIGDFDQGMEFMDTFINYYAKKWHVQPENIGSKNQYLIIKKAFEQDKAEGFKGCIEAKSGEVCMGRATKALIQSDYFPW